MRKLLSIFAAVITALTLMNTSAAEAENSGPLYELRVYYAAPGKLEDLNARFRNHTAKLFEKHGMTNVGYWVPIDNKENKLVYVLAFPSKEARDTSLKSFGGDPEWQKAAKESEKNGKLVDRIESVFMKLTDYSPQPKIEKTGNRVFELRTYTTPPGKLENLNARFKNHTLALFKKHGMENLWYWTKTPGSKDADTTLIYLLAHKSEQAGKASFDSFRKDPDWVKAKGESEKDGSLTVQGGVKSEYLNPTDYSPLQ